jgi:hypothetical protein
LQGGEEPGAFHEVASYDARGLERAMLIQQKADAEACRHMTPYQ